MIVLCIGLWVLASFIYAGILVHIDEDYSTDNCALSLAISLCTWPLFLVGALVVWLCKIPAFIAGFLDGVIKDRSRK